MRKHCGKIKYFYDFQSLQLKKIISNSFKNWKTKIGWKRKFEKPQKFLPAKLNYDNYSFKEDYFILEAPRKLPGQEFILKAKVLTGMKFGDYI